MGDSDTQTFEWTLKNGDIDQVKAIVEKVSPFMSIAFVAFSEAEGNWL